MCDDMRFPMYPRCLVKLVRDAMPADGIICLDNGVYKIWFARNYPARDAQHGAARQRAGDDGRRPARPPWPRRWSIRTARSWRSAATAAS